MHLKTQYQDVVRLLQAIPGIETILAVEDFPLTTVEDIFTELNQIIRIKFQEKAFVCA